MKVLALDPGITTGWAIVNSDNVEDFITGNITYSVLMALVTAPVETLHCNIVVSEGLPPSLDESMRDVERKVFNLFHPTRVIYPGTWKNFKTLLKQAPNVVAISGGLTRRRTQHEKDAYFIAQYFIKYQLNRALVK